MNFLRIFTKRRCQLLSFLKCRTSLLALSCVLLLAVACGSATRGAYAEDEISSEADSTDDSTLDITVDVELDYSELESAIESAIESASSSADDSSVSAATVTDSGSSLSGSAYGSASLSDSVLGLLARVPFWSDYLIVRGSSYDYYIVWGDLSVSDGVFTGNDCYWYDLYSYSGGGGNSGSAVFSVSEGSGSVSIDCSTYTVYSSLDPYPLAEVRTDWALWMLLFAACTAVIARVFERSWVFSQRMRGVCVPSSAD